MTELGRRVMACKGWHWLPGMRIVRHAGGSDRIMDCSEAKLPNDDGYPDLFDPCTIGGLLHLVREAWGDVGAYVRPEPYVFDGPKAWVVVLDPPNDDEGDILDYPEMLEFEGDSEGASLVAALEGAP